MVATSGCWCRPRDPLSPCGCDRAGQSGTGSRRGAGAARTTEGVRDVRRRAHGRRLCRGAGPEGRGRAALEGGLRWRAPSSFTCSGGLGFGGNEALCLQIVRHAPPEVDNVVLYRDPARTDMLPLFQDVPGLSVRCVAAQARSRLADLSRHDAGAAPDRPARRPDVRVWRSTSAGRLRAPAWRACRSYRLGAGNPAPIAPARTAEMGDRPMAVGAARRAGPGLLTQCRALPARSARDGCRRAPAPLPTAAMPRRSSGAPPPHAGHDRPTAGW